VPGGAGAEVEEVAGTDDCVVPLATGLAPNKLGAGAAAELLGAGVPDAVLEVVFPPRLPKRLGVDVAGGAVVLGAVVVTADKPLNKLEVEGEAEEVCGLLRPEMRLPLAAGVAEAAVEFEVPKRLPAGGADDEGCDVGVLLWKLNVGFEGLEAVVGRAVGPEVAGVDEPKPLNKLLDPAGFAPPNRPPEVAEAPANGEAPLAGVWAGSEGLDAPNSGVCEPVEPKRLLPAGFEVLSVGGGPAGVVELPKLKKGLLGAGVVDPAGADVEAFVDELPLNILCPAGLFKPPKRLGVDVPPVLFSLPAAAVDAPLSSFFCPKVKAPSPKDGVDWPAPPNSEPAPPVVAAGFPKAPAAGAFPVLLPNSDGVDAPEPGLDPEVPPPKNDGAVELPVLEVLPRLPKRPPDGGGCEVADC
jgi:hypothetical protein